MRRSDQAAGAARFEGDSWLDWEPDPGRAARDAVPGLLPYATLARRELLDLMLRAEGGREWEFLQEYFLDLCCEEDIALGAEEFIWKHYAPLTEDEVVFLAEAVGLSLRHRALNRRHAGRLRSRLRGEVGVVAGVGEDPIPAGWQDRPAPGVTGRGVAG